MPFTVHMPKIGCGLAGGDWNKVEEIVCPRCHERVAVNVPLYKEQKTSSEEKSSQANFQEQQR